jgi:ribosome-associated protein YbcJ (S4-like RNA binding protein)
MSSEKSVGGGDSGGTAKATIADNVDLWSGTANEQIYAKGFADAP